jgi:1-acyl-sn-glycerol-3-phosphate acyltransferase
LSKAHLFTRTYRISRIATHTIVGLAIAAVVLPLTNQSRKRIIIRWWCGGLMRAFAIQVNTFGDLPPSGTQGVMFVANHISWSDIHALNSKIALRFIAKSDIKSWPVFGYLVTKANTLFIDREKRQEAGRIVETISASLIAGDNLCFFPEGTTTDGTQILPFKSSALQAAISANTRIWPVAIKYVSADGGVNTAMAYAAETTLMESMSNIIAQKNAIVELHFLAPIAAAGYDRRELSNLAYQAISAKLALTPNPAHHDSPA